MIRSWIRRRYFFSPSRRDLETARAIAQDFLAMDAKAVALGSDAVAAGMWVTTEDGPRYVDLTDAEQVAWWRAQIDADSAT